MGKCNIDHSLADVFQKYEDQKSFLPGEIAGKLESLLKQEQDQETLNEVFHLLKKYDLASESEREERNEKIIAFTG